MATSSTPIFPVVIQNSAMTWVAADATTVKTIVTAGANGTKIESVTIASTDTTLANMQFWLSDGITNYLIGTIPIPATAGFIPTAFSLNIFTAANISYVPYLQLPSDSNGNRYLYLKSGWSLKAGTLMPVTTAKTVYATSQSADF